MIRILVVLFYMLVREIIVLHTTKKGTEMGELLEYLMKQSAGTITDRGELKGLLMECWNEFDGYRQQNMKREKLVRIENVKWDGENLVEFALERHGSLPFGSKRAPIYRWVLDLKGRVANCSQVSYRQIIKNDVRFDCEKLAGEIVDYVLKSENHDAIKYLKNGNAHVVASALPTNATNKQT